MRLLILSLAVLLFACDAPRQLPRTSARPETSADRELRERDETFRPIPRK